MPAPSKRKGQRTKASQWFNWTDERSLLLCAFTLFVLLFGGGGTPAETAETIVLVGTIFILAWVWVVRGWKDYGVGRAVSADYLLALPVLALILLYCLQAVPLPIGLWALLPGRQSIQLNLQTYADLPWLPLSIAPQETLISVLSFLPPLAGYLLAVNARDSSWRMLGHTLLIFGLLTIALQLLQTTGGFFPYGQTQIDFTAGFQANRNAQGDILMMLMALLASRPRGELKARLYAQQQIALALCILVAAIFTGSRAGIFITAVPLVWLLWSVAQELGFSIRSILLSVTVLVVSGAGLFIVLMKSSVPFANVMSRFGIGSDGRTNYIWPDSQYAVEQFWPLGSGAGTFMTAFRLFETQESIIHSAANRAHNEALEVMIESGLPGVVLVAIIVLAVFWRAAGEIVMGASVAARRRAVAVLMVSALLVLHSAVDYPMRSMSIATLWAVMLGMLVADRRRRLSPAAERLEKDDRS